MNFESSVELPCGDSIDVGVSSTGTEVGVYVTDDSVDTYLSVETARQLAAALNDAANTAEENARTQVLRGKRYVLTGKFPGGREAITERIRKAGGAVVGRIGPGVTVLTGELPWDGTWKSKNAAAKGGTLQSYAEVVGLLAQVEGTHA